MKIDFNDIPCFGIAGNFTGHLEQAGEAIDFKNIKAENKAPKGIFPTFLPIKGQNSLSSLPEYLKTYPFDENKIIFPHGEEKLQIEPECALICAVNWTDTTKAYLDKLTVTPKKEIIDIVPLYFAASNDCSIRKAGAPKISIKKNWGAASKGFASSSLIKIDSFSKAGIINNYRIASFLIRGKELFDYGEDSAICDYSYIYNQLIEWCIEKLNHQKDEGPLENLHSYLSACGYPSKIMLSIGATRYTAFGENNFLMEGDKTAVLLYPENKYSHEEIRKLILSEQNIPEDISSLVQKIVLK